MMGKNGITDPLGILFGRRSIRAYEARPVDDRTVTRLLEAAMAAPSAVAKDPWRFIVLRERENLQQVAEVLPNGRMLATAALGIVVCGDLEAAHDRNLSFLLQDCSAAIQNILLAAHALGLGACWLGIHPREERIQAVKQLLGIPSPVVPVAAVSIGWPGETKEPRTRYQESCVHLEKWQ